MTSIAQLLPKRAPFDVVFNNNKKRRLWLRPYTLRDEAYLQEHYESEELEKSLIALILKP